MPKRSEPNRKATLCGAAPPWSGQVLARRERGRAEVARRHGGGAQVGHAVQRFIQRGHDAGAFPARRWRRWHAGSFPRGCSTLAQRGATSTRSSKPMTFMARAAAPTLPAWLVLIRMKRVFMACSKRRVQAAGCTVRYSAPTRSDCVMMPTSRLLGVDDGDVVVSALGKQRDQFDQVAVGAGHAHLPRHDLAHHFGLVRYGSRPRRAHQPAQPLADAFVPAEVGKAHEVRHSHDADDAARPVRHRQRLDAMLCASWPTPRAGACRIPRRADRASSRQSSAASPSLRS